MNVVKVSIFEYKDNLRANEAIHLGMFDFPAKPHKDDIILNKDNKYVVDTIIFDCDYDYIEVMVYNMGEIDNE